MIDSVSVIAEKVLGYYPKGICWDEDPDAYIRTNEYKRLSEKLNFNKETLLLTNSLIDSLSLDYRGIMYNHLERCLTYLAPVSNNIRVCLDISLLLPNYTVYILQRQQVSIQRKFDDTLKKIDAALESQTISVISEPNIQAQSIMNSTKEELNRSGKIYFIDYQKCISTELPEVRQIENCEPMNLFNALFKEHLVFI